ncbi:MIT domain-containing protein 1 [Parasteatoda tepidariorum]|uniref:MIT domain-containing protein 1 n=1 Tax=Parasteatoda tepidariorum TaxID=114398 RepID=UPI00077F830B|nr:MIT domain-containing protein 1 [Parasteatoda tepidariorum]
MNSKNSAIEGIEQAAISVIRRAVQHDSEGRYPAALACYQEGIQLFLDVIKNTSDQKKLEHLRQKATEYMTRAEKIKQIVQQQKDAGSYHEQIQVPNNGVGFSYESIVSKHLDKYVTLVEIEDPYIRTAHQTYNFLSFCEVLVRFCPELKRILLVTGASDQDFESQQSRFQCIKKSLAGYDIVLDIDYSTTLHDREIRFNNGWIIKIGRGLDYFKPVSKFSIGFNDQNLKACHETTIDIYFKHS